MSGPERTPLDLAHDLTRLGVERGGTLLVHTSFRAVRPVDGGPEGLIEALLLALGPEGTLVMPCWSGNRMELFDPLMTPADRNLGVTAEYLRRDTRSMRGRHCFAFVALGPKAAQIVGDPVCFPPHGSISAVGRVRDLNGQILLLGCGHSENTTIHLAEIEAGVFYRRLKRCVLTFEGIPFEIDYAENDHCCERFCIVDGWMRGIGRQHEGRVGAAQARLMYSRDLVSTVANHLDAKPELFLHGPNAGCVQCDEARTGALVRQRHDTGSEG